MTTPDDPSKWKPSALGRWAGGCLVTVGGIWLLIAVLRMVEAMILQKPGADVSWNAGLVTGIVSFFMIWLGVAWFRANQ